MMESISASSENKKKINFYVSPEQLTIFLLIVCILGFFALVSQSNLNSSQATSLTPTPPGLHFFDTNSPNQNRVLGVTKSMEQEGPEKPSALPSLPTPSPSPTAPTATPTPTPVPTATPTPTPTPQPSPSPTPSPTPTATPTTPPSSSTTPVATGSAK